MISDSSSFLIYSYVSESQQLLLTEAEPRIKESYNFSREQTCLRLSLYFYRDFVVACLKLLQLAFYTIIIQESTLS